MKQKYCNFCEMYPPLVGKSKCESCYGALAHNVKYIKKEPFEVGLGDLVELIPTENGRFKEGDSFSFDHIRYNGRLVTDPEEVKRLI